MHTLSHSLALFTLRNQCWEHTVMRHKCRKKHPAVYVGPNPAQNDLWETPHLNSVLLTTRAPHLGSGTCCKRFLQRHVCIPEYFSWSRVSSTQSIHISFKTGFSKKALKSVLRFKQITSGIWSHRSFLGLKCKLNKTNSSQSAIVGKHY